VSSVHSRHLAEVLEVGWYGTVYFFVPLETIRQFLSDKYTIPDTGMPNGQCLKCCQLPTRQKPLLHVKSREARFSAENAPKSIRR